MKREYAQEPLTTSVVQLNAQQAEVTLRENISAETKETASGTETGQQTVYTAQEYTIIVPWREGLAEAVSGNYSAWLATARAKELAAMLPEKLSEISAACHAAIVAGCKVTLANGTAESFSLEETDQINLNAAYAAVEQGATGYPYHADGALCRLYTAEDITAIAQAATAHKLYHTTYCNHLMAWAKRAETSDELASIVYGATLPDDLAANMQEVIANASASN